MAKFYGPVGYGHTIETKPGVFKDEITERNYTGEVIRDTRQLQGGDKVNDDISVTNSISIMADGYASENFFAIRYVGWAGTLWKVSDIEVQRPRLILRLGGVYNGQRPAPVADTP